MIVSSGKRSLNRLATIHLRLSRYQFTQAAFSVIGFVLIFCLNGDLISAQPDNEFIITSIVDGDTLLAHKINDTSSSADPIKIQLLGIDAPEDSNNPKLQYDMKRTQLTAEELQVLGHTATAFLKEKISNGSRIIVKADLNKRDRYGRLPALVFPFNTPSISLNEHMISNGFAIKVSIDSLDKSLEQKLNLLQKLAVEQKTGLWGDYPTAAQLWSSKQ